ncbi:Rpn family recombination-promoting nuclease/putative transposase [Eshraghiella crossota]|uniref:Rpn family recombination-promoting nuclease/putative transposase n=1 Tax=Eshraghiella crossota TaxID=45851 RepID=UPI001F606F63|nr:Rpn family recombination-promoting nuclease/putative transposase [Butyrivibrio crossotus]MEE0315203.1 Rpn family recombination-promoting nuclease/putative transposase [Butyrivibrio crossotus]UWO50960.1 Rpn family recombination-promoting nuclease/putative transposase [Butyrivibrio crossotus]
MGQKDILLKDYFTPDIFADAINAILYDGKSVVTPERMRTIDIETQRVEDENGNVTADTRLRDSAKVVEVDDAIYCLFAIEHQSVEDYTMPLRIMEYDVREYLRQVKSNKGVQVRIKPIITIVMYWKADKWNQPVSVKDMFDKNTVRWLEYNGLGGYIQDYRMHLFEPGTVKEEDLEKFKTELKDVIAYVKYSKSTEALKDYNEKYKPDLTKSTVTLINELTNSKYVFIEGKERLDMCEAFEGLIEEGRAKGKAEELKEKYKSWVTLSNNLKKRGMSNPEIASLLGVPETELQKAFKMIKEEKTEKMNMK